MVPLVFKTSLGVVRSPEGSTPSLLRHKNTDKFNAGNLRLRLSLNFSRIEKNKAALYGIKAVSPNSYAKGEERPYGNRVYNRTDGISAIGAARSDRKI